MGEHHVVGLVTGTITPWAYSLSSWAFSDESCGNGTRRGVLTQIGVASGCSLTTQKWTTPLEVSG